MAARVRVTQVLEATAGGTRRHLCEIASALDTDEFEVHIICAIGRDLSFREDVIAFEQQGHRVTIIPMTPGFTILQDARAIFRIRRILKSVPCDVLHLHSAKAGWLGRLAALGLSCQVAYSPHAFPFLRNDPFYRRFAYRLAERITARMTDVLVAVSHAEARLATESGLFEADRVRVLPNSLDVHEVDQATKKAMARSERSVQRRFGMLGELRPQKDPLVLLEALRLLRDRGTPVSIVLPRKGVDLPLVEQYIERHELESFVEFVPAELSLRRLLVRCDIGVMPSLWDGLPYSILEALALRRPVIASDLPVFEDLLRPLDPRLLFPKRDSGALADRLALWAKLPTSELNAVGDRGRRRVVEDHDPKEWRRSLLEIYRCLAGTQQ